MVTCIQKYCTQDDLAFNVQAIRILFSQLSEVGWQLSRLGCGRRNDQVVAFPFAFQYSGLKLCAVLQNFALN